MLLGLHAARTLVLCDLQGHRTLFRRLMVVGALIGGRMVDSGGNGVAGATVTLDGSSSDSRVTDATGAFLFLGAVPGGSYTVTPSRPGFTFNPASFSIGNLDTNVSEIVLTGAATLATPTPTPGPTPSSTFQHSAASYAVGEGAGRFTVTVTRSGDTTLPAEVEYATFDGTASDRGDYTTAVGRLSFAAGETARDFDVFVTDDAHVEGSETVQLTLSNASHGSQVSGAATALLTIVDNDTAPTPVNPVDSAGFFVRQHYVDFLNREPNPTGFVFWVNNIESCGADAAAARRSG